MTPPDPPVFAEPWQAQVFALAVTLNERGLFTWSEWTTAFGVELQAEADYFEAWLRTLEKITVAKGFARDGELEALAAAWLAAAEATPHGRPIVLGADKVPRRDGYEQNRERGRQDDLDAGRTAVEHEPKAAPTGQRWKLVQSRLPEDTN